MINCRVVKNSCLFVAGIHVGAPTMCGPLDMDDPQPAITVMMPDED